MCRIRNKQERDRVERIRNSLALLRYPGILSPRALTCSKSQSPKSISDTRICGRAGRLGAIISFQIICVVLLVIQTENKNPR